MKAQERRDKTAKLFGMEVGEVTQVKCQINIPFKDVTITMIIKGDSPKGRAVKLLIPD